VLQKFANIKMKETSYNKVQYTVGKLGPAHLWGETFCEAVWPYAFLLLTTVHFCIAIKLETCMGLVGILWLPWDSRWFAFVQCDKPMGVGFKVMGIPREWDKSPAGILWS